MSVWKCPLDKKECGGVGREKTDTELKIMLNLQELDLECCPKPVVFVLHNCLSAKVHSLT